MDLEFLDIGLLLALSRVEYKNLFFNQNLNDLFSGIWAEQFVGQELNCLFNSDLHYWARNKTNSSAEVDYVVQKDGEIIPIEVKSGASGKLKSLHLLLKENPHLEKAYVFSTAPFGIEDKLNFLPIFYTVHLS